MGRAGDEELAGFLGTLYGVNEVNPGKEDRLLGSLISDAYESATLDRRSLTARAHVIGASALAEERMSLLDTQIDAQAEGIIAALPANLLPERRLLAAANAIAQKAYAGKTRKSGTPYYEHPRRVAAMGFHILGQLETDGFTIDSDFKDIVVADGLLHDASEETIRSCRYYDPHRPESFSPHLVQRTFEKLGSPYAPLAATGLRLMTHYTHEPWMPTYQEYYMIGSSDFIFCLVKALDMYDNLHVDPKPLPENAPDKVRHIKGKQRLYAEGMQYLSIAAGQRTDSPDNVAWTPRFFTILRGIKASDMPELTTQLDEHIYEKPYEMKAAS